MGRTWYFLFLQLQLSLHVRERGLNLLEVLVRFGVCSIEVFMLPLFLSVGIRGREVRRARRQMFGAITYKDTRSNSLSIVSVFASLPTSLRNLGLLTSKLRNVHGQRNRTREPCGTHIFCISFFLLFISALLISNLALESACKLRVLISPFKSSL